MYHAEFYTIPVVCFAAQPAGQHKRAIATMGISVDDRVVGADGHRGTVRYVGPVATSKTADAIYAGVEWDATGRGKGDGAVTLPDGSEVRYFTCPPGQASFIKVELLSTGTSMLAALAERYEGGSVTSLSSPLPTPAQAVAAASTSSTTSSTRGTDVVIAVELAGEDKIRAAQKLARLTSASLAGSTVSFIERGGALLSSLLPRLREVDLSGTLVGRWSEVAALGAALPALRVLNLGGNVLEYLGDVTVEALPHGCLGALGVLVLNGTRLTWDQVQRVSALAPALQELHLVRCGLQRTVEQPPGWDPARARMLQGRCGDSFVPPYFPSLHTLNLGGNPLGGGQWGAAYALGHMPALQRLLLADCGFLHAFADVGSAVGDLADAAAASAASTVPAGGGAAPPSGLGGAIQVTHPARMGLFTKLDTLSLSGSRFSSVSSIDALDTAFPCLAALRLGHADLAFAPGSEVDGVLPPPLQAAAPADASSGAHHGPAVPTSSSSSSPRSSSGSPALLGLSEARQLIVARLPRLTSLNGSAVGAKERLDAEKAYARRVGAAFAQAWEGAASGGGANADTTTTAAAAAAWPVAGRCHVTDIFGCKSVTLPDEAWQRQSRSDEGSRGEEGGTGGRRASEASDAPASGRAHEQLPSAFRRAGDGGVIRAHQAQPLVPYPIAPFPAFAVSAPQKPGVRYMPPYIPQLDPCGLGASNPAAAGALQRAFPRYFILAAAHDLHAQPPASGDAGSSNLASSVVDVSLRSIAGRSCTIEPVTKRLPLSMTVGAIKQLAARLFKCPDIRSVQLSFLEAGATYPVQLDDDLKPLSYYGVTAGGAAEPSVMQGSEAAASKQPVVGEIILEEVDAAEAARKAEDAQLAEQERIAAQSALGDALRRAADADRRGPS